MNRQRDELRAKYNDLRPYIKTAELQQKIDELFNWFNEKIMHTEVERGLSGFGEVMKERERIINLVLDAQIELNMDEKMIREWLVSGQLPKKEAHE